MFSFRRLFGLRRLSSSRQPLRRSVQLSLEALEERYCPVSSVGAASVSNSFTSGSGSFANNGDVLNTSNDSFRGANTFGGHVSLSFKITNISGGNITATVSGSGDSGGSGSGITFTPSGTATAKLSGTNFVGRFNWTATDNNTPTDSVRGFGYFFGTENGSGAVQNGKYFDTITSDDPTTDYYTWTGSGNGKWSGAANWSVNGKAATSPPGNSSIVIFDGTNNVACEDDTTVQPWATIIQGGYNNNITIDSGKTFTPNFYADSFASSNQFNVAFQSNTATLNMSQESVMGNFDWKSGGAVSIPGEVIVGNGSGFTCQSESSITVTGYLYTGAWQYNNLGSSTFYLDNDAADLTLSSSGYWHDYQSNATDISCSLTKAEVIVNGYASFTNPNGLSSAQSSNIAIPMYINGSGAYVYMGSAVGGFSSSTPSSFFNFTQPFAPATTAPGYAIYLHAGHFDMNNGSKAVLSGGYYQDGGTFWDNDTSDEYLYVNNTATDKINFNGGEIRYNDTQGPAGASYGSIHLDGVVSMSSTDVYMSIKGTTGFYNDDIIDSDASANFTLNNSSTVHVTVNGSLTTGLRWNLVQLQSGAGPFLGDKQFGVGTGLPLGLTENHDNQYVYLQS